MGDLSLADCARARRYAQPVLRLDERAISPEASALVSHCLNELVLPSFPPQRPSSAARIREALEASLAGLIAATGAEWGDGWLRRPMSNDSFTAEPVSRVHFRKVLTALSAAGIVETAPGFQDRASGRLAATRVRLTEAGRKLAERHKVTGSDVGSHFAKADG